MIYTFNNKCLEFDNKLITKASEPPTEGWSANSADVINTMETTNYEFTATDMDIVPTGHNTLMLAFNNVTYPSATDPRNVIFYPD